MRGMIRNGVALGVIALLAAACGSSTTTSAPSSSATTPSNTSGAGASTTGSFKACMVTDTGGINDKSFNQAIYQGILAAAASNPKITTKYLLSTTTADYASNITAFLGQKCGIIVTNGFLMGAATQAAAKAVQTADQSGQNVNMMWVDTDGCVSLAQYCKYFITSVEKGISTSVKVAVLNAAAGRFVGGNYIGTLSNGGVGLAPYHLWTGKVPASLQAELKTIQTQIENGTIKPVTKSPV